MKFGPVDVAECAGTLLAHSLTLDGRRLKKGHLLSAADAAALAASGVAEVIAARLEPGDVPEDEAAARIAADAGGAHVRVAAPFTGRANLYAAVSGVTLLDVPRLTALNHLHEAVTIATLPPFEAVEVGQMLATVKVIPFAAPAEVVVAAERLAAESRDRSGGLVRLAPLRAQKVGLILTLLPGTKDNVLEKTISGVRARVEALGAELAQVARCRHETADLARRMQDPSFAGCDLILVFGASAIVDRGDVIPAGIEAAGGRVLHFGMPVDPGNLLLLGALDQRPVVGLPGCARSPKLNGFDWVLQRLLADIPLTGADLMDTGVGGLLKEIPTRPQPRDAPPRDEGNAQFRQAAEGAPRMPRIAAIVLAAGQSRRMGAHNKLTSLVGDRPLVRWVAEAALASAAVETVVVLGNAADAVRQALDGLPLRFVENPDYRDGIAGSIAAGIAALGPEADGALICLADMPGLRSSHLDRLISAFNPVEGRAICVPTVDTKQGNPVLWGRMFFQELQNLEGDRGAKALLAAHPEMLAEVPMGDDGVLVDLDTPQALAAYRARP